MNYKLNIVLIVICLITLITCGLNDEKVINKNSDSTNEPIKTNIHDYTNGNLNDLEIEPQKPQSKHIYSDLRKEFPKNEYIKFGKEKLNLDIQDIYFGRNRSYINAVIIHTETKFGKEKLLEIQEKLHELFWDFSTTRITTLVKQKEEIYAVIKSKRKDEEINSMIHKFNDIQSAVVKTISKLNKFDNSPLKGNSRNEIFISTFFLKPTKQDYSKLEIFILSNDGKNIKFHRYLPRLKFDTKGSDNLYSISDSIYSNLKHNYTLNKFQEGMVSRQNDSDFAEKYTSFYLKIK